jgi:uncharacterized membrane protein YuzA (DUF378 family)
MWKETTTLISELFFMRHLELIGAINCGLIGSAFFDVIAQLLVNFQGRETACRVPAEKGGR